MDELSAMPTDLHCPCCGGTIASLRNVAAIRHVMTPRERDVFNAILASGKRGCSREDIYSVLYATDPNGGPSDQTIAVRLSHMRNKLRHFGLTIRLQQRHGQYFIAPYDGKSQMGRARNYGAPVPRVELR
jgi:hypothetical protein